MSESINDLKIFFVNFHDTDVTVSSQASCVLKPNKV